MTKVDVQEAIEAEEARRRDECDVTVERLTADLRKAYDKAMQAGQASAAVQAIMGIGKLHGLLVDKSEVNTTERFVVRMPPGKLTTEEWQAEAQRVLGGDNDTTPDPSETKH